MASATFVSGSDTFLSLYKFCEFIL
jgi:hypothetical protein